jgi:hypothetical protein
MGFKRALGQGGSAARTFGLTLLILAVGLLVAYSRPGILDDFVAHYPSTTIPDYTQSVTGDECLDCHVEPRRGEPGNAYREDLIATNEDFFGLDLVDSDGDRVDNQTEANTTRTDFPLEIGGVPQVGYNPGLIDCPDGRLGYDPVSLQVVTGVHETPPGGVIWTSEDPLSNCADNLDNDCDGFVDGDDPDCVAECVTDADCSDGLFCNGAEICVAGACQLGTPPPEDDGIDCTVDFCDEDSDTIVHDPNDAFCDDGLFCTGAETCDPQADCLLGTPPCAEGEICDEDQQACLPAPACSDGIDNDGDELIDFPSDPGCNGPDDDDERDPLGPACDDGSDNDGDGFADFPDDPGCSGPADDDETDPVVVLQIDSGSLFWNDLIGVLGFDVVRGDLLALNTTGGDFTAATEACMEDDFAGTATPHDTVLPDPGQGSWFLVRVVFNAVNGTYDSGSPSQVGLRDAEIDASLVSCP